MADLKLRILADLSKLKTDLDKLFKEKLKIGVGGDGGGGGITGKLGLGKLAIIAGGILVVAAGVKKLVKGLAQASPFLKGIFSMFKRATVLFFRPFGDFLATLLRPLAILLLRASAKWLQFFRGATLSPEGQAAAKGLEPIQGGIMSIINVAIAEWLKGIKDAIADFDIKGKLKSIWDTIVIGFKAFGKDITRFGKWAWGILTAAWSKSVEVLKGIGDWLWDKITDIWEWTHDFGIWLWDEITDSIGDLTDALSGLGDWLWDKITSAIGDFFGGGSIFGGGKARGGKGFTGSFQTGTSFVPETGLAMLHRGEEVIPANRARSKTTIFKPNFNFSGSISSELDIDSLMRRASRQAEINLKRFTSI